MGRRSEHSQDEQRRMALDAAHAIVRRDGLRALSVRRIAGKMGYAAGTLYQLFEDLDDLIIIMNSETLEKLYASASKVEPGGEPSETLIRLAEVYIRSVTREPKLWNAVFEYSPPVDRVMPARYQGAVAKLLGLVQAVLAPLFPPGEEAGRLREARVMWAGLYGIATLASSRKSSVEIDSSAMVRTLATTYLAGLKALRAEAGTERKPRRTAAQ
ncbi:MAG: TetR/AcrR family transcriptional regulator [Cucumibacter sp.]